MAVTEVLKKTPLSECHIAAGAKMVDFGGWHLPLQYQGIIDEHKNVRKKAGLFDVSHMGEIAVGGPNALALLQKVITNDAGKLAVKQALYSPMCGHDGGIVDDLLVYRLGENNYLLVINAANTEKDYRWITEHAVQGVSVNNNSDNIAQLAIQGPLAEPILQKICGCDLSAIKYYWFDFCTAAGADCLVSRTGYTGEDGFEVYTAREHAPMLWDSILHAGAREGIQPAGLGARDTLRLEASLPLYGNELSDKTTPFEAGLGIFVKLDKPDFIGKAALVKQKQKGIPRKLVGFEMLERGIARHGYEVLQEGKLIGHVTSGSYAPTLQKNIGLALLNSEAAAVDQPIAIKVRDRLIDARTVGTPFYRREVH